MTFAPREQQQDGRVERARGRGWRYSLGAVLAWEAALTLTMLAAIGPPSGDDLYYWYGPMLFTIAIVGTPLTYVFAWRRPRPFAQVLLYALPVVVVAFALTNQGF